MNNDLLLFSEENMFKQIAEGEFTLGFYKLKFFTANGIPSPKETGTVSEFYIYPSGGTLRDSNFNIIGYYAKFDTYKGFVHPKKDGV
jgi:hypothetical protein